MLLFISVPNQTGFEGRSFFIVRFERRGGRALLDYPGHRLTEYNGSQMTLLDLVSVM